MKCLLISIIATAGLAISPQSSARIGETLTECQRRYPGLTTADIILEEKERNLGTNRLGVKPEFFVLHEGSDKYWFDLKEPPNADYNPDSPTYLTRVGDYVFSLRFVGGKCAFIGIRKYGKQPFQYKSNTFSPDEVHELVKRNLGSKAPLDLITNNSYQVFVDNSEQPALIASYQPRASTLIIFTPEILPVFSSENAARSAANDAKNKAGIQKELQGF